jgi:predicted acylesterase/phospholipase RssA
MPTHDYPYKNLVFEGGGVKGVAYGGVFEVLEQRHKSHRRLNQR